VNLSVNIGNEAFWISKYWTRGGSKFQTAHRFFFVMSRWDMTAGISSYMPITAIFSCSALIYIYCIHRNHTYLKKILGWFLVCTQKMSKITKNRQNLSFLIKSPESDRNSNDQWKFSIFDQNFQFFTKISILDKKNGFLTKNSIFQKIKILKIL